MVWREERGPAENTPRPEMEDQEPAGTHRERFAWPQSLAQETASLLPFRYKDTFMLCLWRNKTRCKRRKTGLESIFQARDCLLAQTSPSQFSHKPRERAAGTGMGVWSGGVGPGGEETGPGPPRRRQGGEKPLPGT